MTETSSHELAALALENVGKRFGSVIALSDVSMSVPKNQVTCVLGDNGAGKSTLIKILSGVHTPSDGQMYVNGEPTTFVLRARLWIWVSPPCSKISRPCP